MRAGIAAGKLEMADYGALLGLKAAQDVFFTTFLASTSKELREFFAKTVAGGAVDEMERMRAVVVKGGLSGEMQGLDAKGWFNAATARIDLLKTVEDRAAADLAALTARINADANRALLVLAIVMAAGITIGMGVVVVMARSITRPLAELQSAMDVLARGDTGLVVPGQERRDEIGEMAQAVEVFRNNAIERTRLEAEQRQAEIRAVEEKRTPSEREASSSAPSEQKAAAERKAAMHRLADEFENGGRRHHRKRVVGLDRSWRRPPTR